VLPPSPQARKLNTSDVASAVSERLTNCQGLTPCDAVFISVEATMVAPASVSEYAPVPLPPLPVMAT